MPRSRRPSKPPEIAFSNLGKIFFPETRFTKGDLIKYYLDVAPVLLPHLRKRPVTLIRMPDGVRGERFYEKNAPGHTPDWVQTTHVPRSEGGVINYVMINDAPTLAWCANNAAIELHPFLHRAENLRVPTHLAFDLDPGEGADLLTCIEVGFLVREVLAGVGLRAFPKVTGSKGLQLYVPLNRGLTYEFVTPFAKSVAELLRRRHSDLIVSEMSKALRVGKVFIDWSQNHEKKTTVGPYSVRGKRDAPFVSMPVTWEELKRGLKAGRSDALFFSPAEALKRVAKKGDLFAPVLTLKQRLPEAFRPDEADANGGTRRTKTPTRTRSRARGGSKRAAASSLKRYAEKRDFSKTPEPEPEAALPKHSAQGSRRRFVVQKHAASHLHYDFRLEMHDVLKSWAVPKGIPTELGVKRSAFQTEDHPPDYFSFEGVIPAGEYGGGTVMVWDIGTYDVIDGDYGKGSLKLFLAGRKLRGEWHLFRIKNDDTKPVWLIQKAGEPAKAISAKRDDTSVLTGRTMKQIAAARDAVWRSDRTGGRNKEGQSGGQSKAARGKAPAFVEPMTARLVTKLPDGDDWIYEIKLDGCRALGIKHGDDIRLLSRKKRDIGGEFPAALAALGTIRASSALIDGEIVALDREGRPSFERLQQRGAKGHIVFYAFDLLSCDGENWRGRPLEDRKAKLAEILAGSDVRFSASFDGPAARVFEHGQRLGLEGIVAKRRDSKYQSGRRSSAWVELKF